MNRPDSSYSPLSRRSAITAGLGAGSLALLSGSLARAQDQGDRGDAHGDAHAPSDKLMSVLKGTLDGDKYALPKLPYAYDALEPHIDQLTMELHHDKHHQGYVDGLNSAADELMSMAKGEDSGSMYAAQRNLSFNYAGHLLHSLFWASMGPGDGEMGGEPTGKLAGAITKSFGSFTNFKSQFQNAGGSVKGSGWVMLMFEPIASRLFVSTCNEHDVYFPTGAIPVMPCDIWEHAYYLNYQNRRTEYLEAFFKVIDWSCVGEMYELHAAMHSRD